MNGFIEVDTPIGMLLINVGNIQCVARNQETGKANILFTHPDDYMHTNETYEEVQRKIKETRAICNVGNSKPLTNLEYIKAMDVKEMAKFINDIGMCCDEEECDHCPLKNVPHDCTKVNIEEWLKMERS